LEKTKTQRKKGVKFNRKIGDEVFFVWDMRYEIAVSGEQNKRIDGTIEIRKGAIRAYLKDDNTKTYRVRVKDVMTNELMEIPLDETFKTMLEARRYVEKEENN
jgi:hypothetical protein